MYFLSGTDVISVAGVSKNFWKSGKTFRIKSEYRTIFTNRKNYRPRTRAMNTSGESRGGSVTYPPPKHRGKVGFSVFFSCRYPLAPTVIMNSENRTDIHENSI